MIEKQIKTINIFVSELMFIPRASSRRVNGFKISYLDPSGGDGGGCALK